MKIVKFNELPQEVQDFLNRVFDTYFPSNHKFELDWLHNLSEWKDATNEERLAYAEWKFIGRKVICLSDNAEIIAKKLDGINSSGLWGIGYKIINEEKDYGWSVLLYKKDRWAEIVGEPEKIDWSKANKDNIPFEDEPELDKNEQKPLHPMWNKSCVENFIEQKLSEDSKPEFKAGDEVEQGIIQAIVGKNAWVKKPEQVHGLIFWVSELKRLDPDKHLKEIAKGLMGERNFFEYKSSENTFTNLSMDDLKSMLIEMGKRIEALKKGKSL